MTKLAKAKGLPFSASRKIESSQFLIEETSAKPGTSRFQRRQFNNTNTLGNNQNGEEKTDLPTFCQQLLVDGYVQSYIDFYYLTHRADPTDATKKTQISVSLQDMKFLRDCLIAAEMSRRHGNTQVVYNSYTTLADFYKKQCDWKSAIFFHEKNLEISLLTSDSRAEMTANHAIGLIHEMMYDFDNARDFHERHMKIAESTGIEDEIAKANMQLYKVYKFLAEGLESSAENEEAMIMHKMSLEAAKKSWNRQAEGEANGKIGTLLLSMGQVQESIPFLKEQSQITWDLGDPAGRCRACSSLAYAYDSLGLSDKALNELNLVNSISEQSNDTLLQSQACKALGTLYSKLGKLDKAVEILQKHFNLVKAIVLKSANATDDGSTTKSVVGQVDLDLARTYIGISRGNLMMNAYNIAIQKDLSSLLDWKIERTDIIE